MKILLDAMGGDNAPKSTVQGAADAVKEFSSPSGDSLERKTEKTG